MRIYSMTATFGKLEHQTLTLEPGLNVIHAPNEWGKSTWCAFLVSMLYGMDGKRAGGATLADKERYAPWSGAPMSGRMELSWNGRDITIERKTKGRLIFSDFRAYETETGIDIPELTATNCGQMLLGVERSVFTRAGFLKLADLPVTQDESLRRRLNNLVTTGDESGAGDKLGQTLKDLKNKCRYNQSGLLPQVEAEREQLRRQLYNLQDLQQQIQQIRSRQTALDQHIHDLENHKATLRYEASVNDARQVEQARKALIDIQLLVDSLQCQCESLPTMQEAQDGAQQARQLQQQWIQLQSKPVPQEPQAPSCPYPGMTPEQITAQAAADTAAAETLTKKTASCRVALLPGFMAMGICLFTLVLLALVFQPATPLPYILTGIILPLAVIAVILCIAQGKRAEKQLQQIMARHNTPAETWITEAHSFAAAQAQYHQALENWQAQCKELDQQRADLAAAIHTLTGGDTLEDCCNRWEQAVSKHTALQTALSDLQKTQTHADALESMAKVADKPAFEDHLTCSESETDSSLASARIEQRQLELQLGQCLGQIDAIGQESVLRARLDAVNRRITRLEDTYYALEMAQEALHRASTSLQRRFAPRITKRAQELLSKLTGGRYARIIMAEDLRLSASAQDEDTMYDAQWRSDGTIDQLYLALRLAVAEELTPNAPLVLDDALVRFDDQRAKQAMEILQEQAQSKQVIVFTCQGREQTFL